MSSAARHEESSFQYSTIFLRFLVYQKLDNGPSFNSQKFFEFLKELGFVQRRIIALWPRANGMCERFMRNLGKIMRSSSQIQREWEKNFIEFLRNYRATPHSSEQIIVPV